MARREKDCYTLMIHGAGALLHSVLQDAGALLH